MDPGTISHYIETKMKKRRRQNRKEGAGYGEWKGKVDVDRDGNIIHAYATRVHSTAQREVMVAVLPHDSTKRFATAPKTQRAASTLFVLQLFPPRHAVINA